MDLQSLSESGSELLEYRRYARILKAHSHSHSMSAGSIQVSLVCHVGFLIAGDLVCSKSAVQLACLVTLPLASYETFS